MAFALQKRCSTTELSRQRGLAPARAYRSVMDQSRSWVRLRQPVLLSRRERWHSTVRRLMAKVVEIDPLLLPRRNSESTRRSAGVG